MSFTIATANTGLLMPLKTSAQKLAIGSPATGLMCYDTDLHTPCIYQTNVQSIIIGSRITNLVLTSNVVTVSLAINNSFVAGDKFYCSGITDGSWTFLNYQYLTVTSVSVLTVLASYTHADVGTTAITVGNVVGVHNYTSASAIWCNVSSGNERIVYWDTFPTLNTSVWTSSSTLNIVAGLVIYSNDVNGQTITFTSPLTLTKGNYKVNWDTSIDPARANLLCEISYDGGTAWITLLENMIQYSASSIYISVITVYFSLTTDVAPIIRFTANGKVSVATGYFITIVNPFVITMIS